MVQPVSRSRNANDNTTAVNIYGDLVEFMYNANDKKSISINTVDNKIFNIADIHLLGYGGYYLKQILNDIYRNIMQLHNVKQEILVTVGKHSDQ